MGLICLTSTLAAQRKHSRNGTPEESMGPQTLEEEKGRLLRRGHPLPFHARVALLHSSE